MHAIFLFKDQVLGHIINASYIPEEYDYVEFDNQRYMVVRRIFRFYHLHPQDNVGYFECVFELEKDERIQ